jgi:hypothetical protein
MALGIGHLGIRHLGGVVIAMLAASSAGAQTMRTPSQPAVHPPLKPGPSAGVGTAQQAIRPGLALIGAGAIIALVVVTTASSGGGGSGGAQPNSQSVPGTVP